MRRTFTLRASLLAAVLFVLLEAPARAQTSTNYVVRGPAAVVAWGLDEGAIDFELTLVASNDVAPAQGDQPAPGPRLIFRVTRFASLGSTLIRRYWYGDVALPPNALSIGSDLSQ